MKIGKLIIEFRRAGGPKLAEEVFDALTDPEGEARAVIAKMARSAAKDFIDAEAGRILADVSAELEKRKAATLAELGSAAPATISHSSPLEREVRKSVWRLEQELRKMIYTLPAELVCWNSACNTGDPVPHMLDERDHRTIGEVQAETPELCEHCGFTVAVSAAGVSCKSGDSCPFRGKTLKFLSPPAKENQ